MKHLSTDAEEAYFMIFRNLMLEGGSREYIVGCVFTERFQIDINEMIKVELFRIALN